MNYLICETFCCEDEVLVAAASCLATGVPTWVSLTPGPQATAMSPAKARTIGKRLVAMGVQRLLINCVAASKALPFLKAIAGLGTPVGIYANAGERSEGLGWNTSPDGPERYLEFAASWVEAGASMVGGCCGIGPAHIRKLREWVDTLMDAPSGRALSTDSAAEASGAADGQRPSC